MQHVIRTASTVVAVMVALLSAAAARAMSTRAVDAGSMTQIRDVVVWGLAAAAALCLLVAALPAVRRGIGRSVGASVAAATAFLVAMTMNAVALSGSLSAPAQRSMSLLAVVLCLFAATMTALSATSTPARRHESSRL